MIRWITPPLLSTLLFSQEFTIAPIEVEDARLLVDGDVREIIPQTLSDARRDITLSEKLGADTSFSFVRDAKGEMAVSYRGLDFKNTKFVEDGIPLYTPNTGIDASFMMQRGTLYFRDGTSLASTGISSMGGEVIVMQKLPKNSFEGSASVLIATNDALYGVRAGSMQERYYLLAKASYFTREAFTLSKDFTPTPIQAQGERVNSDREQKNISLKAGYFVNDALEIATKLSYSQAVYGFAPNTQENQTSPTFFAYTRMDPKQLGSLYFYGDYEADIHTLSIRAYYDDYKDIYKVYDDGNYTSHLPVVTYDDARLGTTLKYVRSAEVHKSSFTFVAEQNEHKRVGGDLESVSSKVANYNAAFGDIWRLNDALSLETGISFAYMKMLSASDASALNPAEDKKALDGLLTLSYTTSMQKSYLSVAKKSRMPQLYEMSTYFPWEIANPALKPEKSMQYSAGYKQKLAAKSELSVDVYYYDIRDVILNEDSGYINRESAINYGGEFRVGSDYFTKQHYNISYAYTHTQDSAKKPLELIPEHKVRVEDSIKFTKKYAAFLSYSFVGSRYSLNSATYTSEFEKLDAYHLLDAQFIYAPVAFLKMRAGVKNILDALYESAYGYPAEGRSFYFSLEAKI